MKTNPNNIKIQKPVITESQYVQVSDLTRIIVVRDMLRYIVYDDIDERELKLVIRLLKKWEHNLFLVTGDQMNPENERDPENNQLDRPDRETIETLLEHIDKGTKDVVGDSYR